MLTFRNTIIIFLVVLVTAVLTKIFLPVSPWWYIGMVLTLMILLAWGSVNIRADFYLRSHSSGDRNRKIISLTFDDGPDSVITPVILDILLEYNIKATFFVIGSKAERNPEILLRMHKEGHLIGGHSYSHHFFFDLFSGRRMRHELMRTQEIVYKNIGERIRLFRPPYGVTNPTVASVIKELNCESIGWSLKSKDTVMKNGNLLLKRLTNKIKNGDIILFHDNRPWIADQLRAFLKYLDGQQYRVERIDHFLHIQAYEN
jgi:peptidoglycan/xylan/chitin deacetylase (PgdA/CDA1 family)